ncbi:hypothetical protein AYO21_09138 [Fonsecaea monophora]|uniref:Uncharacterized protein n=1 Tax=Fonsecaea monophora TaxID=254056 RepID=A0A177EX93_9EURO|nr:hypothetical protein AYO21_09138 [Fonsecaea monophora]OAG36663.1 hypothetical protein AYO21_09138 [Fonsecaea monophora]
MSGSTTATGFTVSRWDATADTRLHAMQLLGARTGYRMNQTPTIMCNILVNTCLACGKVASTKVTLCDRGRDGVDMKVSMDLKVIMNTTVVWAALNIVVTDALVLLPSENMTSHMTPYMRIGLPMAVFSRMYSALRVAGDQTQSVNGVSFD